MCLGIWIDLQSGSFSRFHTRLSRSFVGSCSIANIADLRHCSHGKTSSSCRVQHRPCPRNSLYHNVRDLSRNAFDTAHDRTIE